MNAQAIWTIELNTTCPHCGKDINVLDSLDIWEYLNGLKIGDNVENVSAYCPECGKDFVMDVFY